METKNYLKKLRKEKNISTRELSRIFDVEETSVSQIERGKKNLTIDMLKKYCEFFNESADIILNQPNRIPNIIYENNELIIYNFKIEDVNHCYDQLCSFKIKFKEKKWNEIFIKWELKFNYYDDIIETYKPTKKSNGFYTSLIDHTENETLVFTLLDCKQDENYNFFHYPIENANFKIIYVKKPNKKKFKIERIKIMKFKNTKRKKAYITKEGYIQIHAPNHPNARKGTGYVGLHVYKATNGGKRKLNKNEVSHHIDGNKLNNKKSNLKIISRSEHFKIHNKKHQDK